MDLNELRGRGWPCPTGAEMGRIDAYAIEACGVPARLLMEAAGRAVAQAVWRLYPEARRPLVACGGGNNGGDGFVVARLLRERGNACEPLVLSLGRPERHSAEARENLELLMRAGAEILVSPDAKEVATAALSCDMLVDAVFGVGLSRPVEGALEEVLRVLSRSGLPSLAVDLPSGISSDTGAPLGFALEAEAIVTLGLPKLGLAQRPWSGEIWVADIGLPEAALEQAGVRQRVMTRAAAAALLPSRPAEGHKGTFGHVLVVGGSEGKTGAAVLAAEGALRTGAGLVTVAAPRPLNPILEVKLTEAMSLPVGDERPFFGAAAIEALLAEARARDALVLGPGIGRHPETERAARELLASMEGPVVVDADALNAFADRPEELRGPGLRVLTPHPGEAARLLARSNTELQGDRVGAARELASRSGAVVLLKGARSVTAAPDGEVWLNPTGGPGLASGGTGDVLAGVVGALLGQGLVPLDAARLGAYLHGLAGDLGPPAGGVASEVASRIPVAWREVQRGDSERDDPGPLARFP